MEIFVIFLINFSLCLRKGRGLYGIVTSAHRRALGWVWHCDFIDKKCNFKPNHRKWIGFGIDWTTRRLNSYPKQGKKLY
jgi:hypothetical protein